MSFRLFDVAALGRRLIGQQADGRGWMEGGWSVDGGWMEGGWRAVDRGWMEGGWMDSKE
jgi:hypothetical protein